MSSSSSSVEEKIRSLPPELRDEAIHFIDELVRRSKKGSPSSFRCVAKGSLAYLGTRYSSRTFSEREVSPSSGWTVMKRPEQVPLSFRLDFDDAYAVAEQTGLSVIKLPQRFRSDRKRKNGAQRSRNLNSETTVTGSITPRT